MGQDVDDSVVGAICENCASPVPALPPHLRTGRSHRILGDKAVPKRCPTCDAALVGSATTMGVAPLAQDFWQQASEYTLQLRNPVAVVQRLTEMVNRGALDQVSFRYARVGIYPRPDDFEDALDWFILLYDMGLVDTVQYEQLLEFVQHAILSNEPEPVMDLIAGWTAAYRGLIATELSPEEYRLFKDVKLGLAAPDGTVSVEQLRRILGTTSFPEVGNPEAIVEWFEELGELDLVKPSDVELLRVFLPQAYVVDKAATDEHLALVIRAYENLRRGGALESDARMVDMSAGLFAGSMLQILRTDAGHTGKSAP